MTSPCFPTLHQNLTRHGGGDENEGEGKPRSAVDSTAPPGKNRLTVSDGDSHARWVGRIPQADDKQNETRSEAGPNRTLWESATAPRCDSTDDHGERQHEKRADRHHSGGRERGDREAQSPCQGRGPAHSPRKALTAHSSHDQLNDPDGQANGDANRRSDLEHEQSKPIHVAHSA